MRILQYLIPIILWLVLGYFVQPCWKSQFGCGVKEAPTKTGHVTPPATKKITGPLLFRWNKGDAITGEGWNAKRKALIDNLGNEDILEITGYYRSDEQRGEKLGLARALEVAKLFKPPLTDSRIRLKAKLVNSGENDKTSMFESASFRVLKNSKNIKEINDKALIYFPFSSTKKLNNADVENYLNDVAERVKKSGERIRLTGHTDSISSDASNYRLGLARANVIKNYLVKRGVPASKIIVKSDGERRPIASNSTEEGRAKNRRTELEIIK